MSKYSIKERNEIYKKVLNHIEEYKSGFICNEIEYFIGYRVKIDEENFPELFLFRQPQHNNAWLSYCEETKEKFLEGTPEGNALRETVLDFCIEMTNENGK